MNVPSAKNLSLLVLMLSLKRLELSERTMIELTNLDNDGSLGAANHASLRDL